MDTNESARPGVAAGTGGEQVGETNASVRRWRRVEIDRCPRGTWSVVAWRQS